MKIIGILKEVLSDESRVSIVPEVAKKFQKLKFKLLVETGAGEKAGFADSAYESCGVKAVSRKELFAEADIVVSVNSIPEADFNSLRPGQLLVGNYGVYSQKDHIKKLANTKVTLLSLELIPRISRAQSMDVLSSQNNLAGYVSVLVATRYFKKALPLMMTSAGMIAPAKVFVMGAGVAGLQAIATAKRLGAVVSGYDVRVATKEQVESLGAKFVVVDEAVFADSETTGGYAKELPADYQEKEKRVLAKHIANQDIIITTALIPGKKSPVLITEEAVKGMGTGSVIVDLAAPGGGNCELTEVGKVTTQHGITIVGEKNILDGVATTASFLYGNNIFNLISFFHDVEKGFGLDYEDELIKGTLVLNNGTLVLDI